MYTYTTAASTKTVTINCIILWYQKGAGSVMTTKLRKEAIGICFIQTFIELHHRRFGDNTSESTADAALIYNPMKPTSQSFAAEGWAGCTLPPEYWSYPPAGYGYQGIVEDTGHLWYGYHRPVIAEPLIPLAGRGSLTKMEETDG